ncbi:MAG: hypothetical protein M1357_01980 [Candidatus Marsarchaeota archaeon]|nr:hypothetical protein [Candidatus Marsarchaeota archaeon]
MVKVYGRDKKGRFVSRRSANAKKAYKTRVERRQRVRSLAEALSSLLKAGMSFATAVSGA